MEKLKKIVIKDSKDNRKYHPWIYRNHIATIDPEINPGDIVNIFSSDSFLIGTGYFNPASLITVRMLSREEEQIDKGFIIKRLSDAVIKRESIKRISNAYRAVFSEADGLPGLIIDIYDKTAVFQITTLGMDLLKQHIVSAILEVINPTYIYEKSDSTSRKLEGVKPVTGWHGREGKEKIIIFEDKAEFVINIHQGHKTGFYLDQRKNRIAAGNFAKDKRVLDLFCYSGGFSIHSALKKASEITGIDIKEKWLKYARENAEVNYLSGKISWIKSNVFEILKKYQDDNRQFDMIILDPPSFLKNKHSLKTALNGYIDLNRAAMRLLDKDGILCTFSCSHHIRNELFSDMIKQSAALENKQIKILKRCHQDKDHPIIKEIPESEYLKGYFLTVS